MGNSPPLRTASSPQDIADDESARERPLTPPSLHDETAPIAAQLFVWQEAGEEACLERLCVAILPVAHRMISATLHRLGIHDPSATDDALSLVLDHLRRLPEASTNDRPVARFAPRSDTRSNTSHADPGLAYIVWLARERAADVARAWRRRIRRATVFSLLDQQTTNQVQERVAGGGDRTASPDLGIMLHDAIPRLASSERLVIELLLEGKSQAVVAHVLDVSEGTVSRLRSRAIATLRELLAE